MWRTIVLSFCLASLAMTPVSAGDPKPFPKFEARRVKAPKKGSRPKITVQITAKTPSVAPAAAPAATQPGAQASSYGWFWSAVSDQIGDQSPAQLQRAERRLQSPPSGAVAPAPPLSQMVPVARQFGPDILRATVGTGVSPALVLAVIMVESGGRPEAVSSAGAAGLMQLMPKTAAEFGVSDRSVPADNIAGGVRYLDHLMQRFDSDPIFVLAGYNAGPGAVATHGGVPPFPETRDYVPKVLAAWQMAKGLCVTPPQLLSDGCVFSVKEGG